MPPQSHQHHSYLFSGQELKIRNESRKILGLPGPKVSAACIRVPVVTTAGPALQDAKDAGYAYMVIDAPSSPSTASPRIGRSIPASTAGTA